MSRIGRKPVPVPTGVKVKIDGQHVEVQGPRGELARTFHPDMQIALDEGTLNVSRPSDERQHRALHGLTRALLANMVKGVTEGFRKVLVVEGVGYRAEMVSGGKALMLHLGYSHPIRVEPPPGIKLSADPKARTIAIEGADREQVGQVAAIIRKLRPPEPYKGKGIRYDSEVVRRKAGKAGKVG
ncbi:MAG TPA: 50S ribosomal protein L6 [Anaerolineae bacterium]|nr:50S ribosomal protein L6 [Anaerolineae bacterium]